MTQPYDSAVNGGKTQMKKKQWEPETKRGWAYVHRNGKLRGFVHQYLIKAHDEHYPGEACVRIIREKDYQRLLKLSKAQAIRRALK